MPVESNYSDTRATWANAYIWPTLRSILAEHEIHDHSAFDLGCGNGATSNMLSEIGFKVTGVDISETGIRLARQSFPHLRFDQGDVYDNLAGKYGTFPLVVSLEVIEHCYSPRQMAKTFHSLVAKGGIGILSTPYHGYLKNLALAVTDGWDRHHGALWDGGHIKFFSIKTLRALMEEVGFTDISVTRVGRIPPFAKSMIAVVRKR